MKNEKLIEELEIINIGDLKIIDEWAFVETSKGIIFGNAIEAIEAGDHEKAYDILLAINVCYDHYHATYKCKKYLLKVDNNFVEIYTLKGF